MKSSYLPDAERFQRREVIRRRIRHATTTLAAIVVFCTTYALILPAITMEKSCTLPEHTHTDACYEQVTAIEKQVPVCTAETPGVHGHTESCYDENGDLLCSGADFIVHEHDEWCYDENGERWCTLPEIEAHTHSGTCYEYPRVHEHGKDCYERVRGALCCPLEKEEGHTHGDGCCDESGAVSCGLEESAEHTHSDECYEWTEVLVCGLSEEIDETAEPELVCTQEEIILHTHAADCYDESGVLVCEKREIRQHQHSAACFETVEEPVDTEVLTCTVTDEAHIHTARCYGTWELVCGLDEHVHTEECNLPEESEEGQEPEELPVGMEYLCGLAAHRHGGECCDLFGDLCCGMDEHTHDESCLQAADEVDDEIAALIARIDALPAAEEVAAILSAYEDAEDLEGYEAYLTEIAVQARTAYCYYEEMEPERQAQITNADKLLDLEWVWSADTLEITDTLTVYQVNVYSQAKTALIYGGKVGEKTSGMQFLDWSVVVIEKNSNGQFYVSKHISDNSDKRSCAAPENGFLLLIYRGNVKTALNVGDIVSISFDYKKVSGYTANGHGTVTTASNGIFKHEKDNSDKLSTVKGADTRDLIEVNLYDYGTNINDKWNSNKKYPGFQQEGGQTGVSATDHSNFGNNITAEIAIGATSVTGKGGAINEIANGANSPISGAMLATLGTDGYPALSDGTSLSYLFTDNTYAEKKNSQSVNGLFKRNQTTGAYTFNSRENHAQFNASDDTFTLYEQIITPNFTMYPFGNFLPFNDIVHESAQVSTIDRDYLQSIANSAACRAGNGEGTVYSTLASAMKSWISAMDAKDQYKNGWTMADAANEYFAANAPPDLDFNQNKELLKNTYSIDYDEVKDFFFGMEMKMNFIQPHDGLTGNDGKQPMHFYFTGDDDVWVYLDGVLFLDLSGIHRHVGGEIDFVEGKVKYYSLDVSTGDVSTSPYKTLTFAEILKNAGRSTDGLNEKGTFEDYSQHSFNFYYMERGAGSGVCRMNFNFPLLRENSVSVVKELSTENGGEELLGNPDYTFQIIRADDGTTPFVGAGVEYEILDASGKPVGTGTTGENGIFTIKAGQKAVFDIKENAGAYFVRELLNEAYFEQYGKIFVDGSSTTTDAYTDVTIGNDTFKGIESPVKDVSDGSTVFHFNNRVTIDKMSHLSLTKRVTGGAPLGGEEYTFSVTLGGEKLPAGAGYTVQRADGTTEQKTVETAGRITLRADETATIRVLAGTKYKIEEIAGEDAAYRVSYTIDGSAAGETCAAGQVTAVGSTVAVIAENCYGSAPLTLQKRVLNTAAPNETGGEFTFELSFAAPDGLEECAFPAVYTGASEREETVTFRPDESGRAVAAVTLRHGESVSISNLPPGLSVTISEPEHSGYSVSWDVNGTASGADSVTVTTGSAATIVCTNTTGYVLPETGGIGTGVFTAGGALLLAVAGMLLGKRRKAQR